jgi:ubiquinone/menaquinone biosynthesis C-methylase UbiE
MLRAGKHTIAVDESRQMSRQAYRRIQIQGLQSYLARAAAQSLPFPTGCFNQVVATFPSEYILAQDTLLEIHRVLAGGGELIILPLAWINGNRWYERLAAWLFRVTGEAPAIETIRNSDRFRQAFEEAGFHSRSEFVDLPGSTLMLVRATKIAGR